MSTEKISQIRTEVTQAAIEIGNVEAQLEAISDKYSKFTRSGRESIVRESLAVIKPKIETNKVKFEALTARIANLGNTREGTQVRGQFVAILEKIQAGLKKMETYGAEQEKTQAIVLLKDINALITRMNA